MTLFEFSIRTIKELIREVFVACAACTFQLRKVVNRMVYTVAQTTIKISKVISQSIISQCITCMITSAIFYILRIAGCSFP